MNQTQATSDRDPAISPTGNSGCVFILSNQIDQRPAIHEEYAQLMRELWEFEIGCHLFQDRTRLNLSSNDIKRAFERLSTTDEASKFDYLVVVISATGCLVNEENNIDSSPHIKGSDGKWFSESEMLASFFNDNHKWKGKPKLFILNYCRFAETSDRYDADNTRQQLRKNKQETRHESHETGRDIPQRIPTISDFTLVYGSSSCLLSEIKEVFSDQWKSKSISQMLTTVNEKMRNEQEWSVFQSSQESTFMLTADITKKTQTLDDFFDEDDRIIYTRAEVLELIERYESRRPEAILSKGCMLLISNALNSEDTSHENDEENMLDLWKKRRLCYLFNGKSYLNKSGPEMKELCQQFSTMESADYDYAVVIISSHGGLQPAQPESEEGSSDSIQRPCIQGYNEQGFLGKRELLELFNRPESRWHNKVKIFIFDYCRGHIDDPGCTKMAFTDRNVKKPNHVPFKYNPNELPPSISTVVHDSIIIYATHSSYAAYSRGLIPTIKKVFCDYVKKESLLELLTRVNAERKHPRKENIAMSLFKSTLTDDYHLHPMARTEQQ